SAASANLRNVLGFDRERKDHDLLVAARGRSLTGSPGMSNDLAPVSTKILSKSLAEARHGPNGADSILEPLGGLPFRGHEELHDDPAVRAAPDVGQADPFDLRVQDVPPVGGTGEQRPMAGSHGGVASQVLAHETEGETGLPHPPAR